jgi:hypothetical protein
MIRVIPPPLEYGVNRELWEAVVDGLNAEGLSARLEAPEEQRGAPEVALAVGIFLAEYVGEEALNTIRQVLWTKLRGKRRLGTMKGKPRRVPVYLPNGDVLTWVEVPSVEPDDDGE